ncbi:MAG TPA: hypothetical protein VGH23_16260 [Rhizomicrobium sp.]
MFDRSQPWLPFIGTQIDADGLLLSVTGGYVDACGVLLLEGETADGCEVSNLALSTVTVVGCPTEAQRAVIASAATGFD